MAQVERELVLSSGNFIGNVYAILGLALARSFIWDPFTRQTNQCNTLKGEALVLVPNDSQMGPTVANHRVPTHTLFAPVQIWIEIRWNTNW